MEGHEWTMLVLVKWRINVVCREDVVLCPYFLVHRVLEKNESFCNNVIVVFSLVKVMVK